MQTPKGIEKAWEFTFSRFFHKEMKLFYDYLVGDGEDAATWHLPTPEEIAKQYPNPCGWGTGMEDAMLTAGSVMDALVARYAVTGEEGLKSIADDIFAGMMRCALVRDDGFLARSISPKDGKSFYFNSSRDQYTHWIYGAIRFYNSGLCSEMQREEIKKVLTSFAERALREVTEENDFSLLRADGKPGQVTKMWGDIGPHEALRLPMFYLAAWYVTGEKCWQEAYLRYRDDGLKMTAAFSDWEGRTYPILQMQYSLRLLYDLDPDEGTKNICADLMAKTADHFSHYTRRNLPELLPRINDTRINYRYLGWREAGIHHEQGCVGGYRYLNPAQSEREENEGFYAIRGFGEALSIVALSGKPAEEELSGVAVLADAIDYEKHCSYAPALLACGYWLGREWDR